MIGRQVSRFYIIRMLGSGGMGVVYEAQDTRLPRSVAIKFLKPALAKRQDAVGRFRREARLASLLNHPNICTILDVDEVDGEAFIAMELLHGQSLKHRLISGALSLEETVDIGTQIAKALAAAHAQGIMHRDIKPGNVFLTSDGVVKLLDFGLAKQFALEETDDRSSMESVTEAGRIVGTVYYMAPEQLLPDLPPDGRCDLYALGAVLYQMASGTRPFDASSKEEVISLILNRPPVPLRRLAPHQPVELERLIGALLSKRAADRPATAAAVQETLQTIRSGPVSRPTPSGLRGQHAVAVLPFRELSPDADGAFVGEGLADDIAAHLTQYPALRVSSRTSTRQFACLPIREIGRHLGASIVVEGSIQQAGGDFRAVAHLVSSADERMVAPSISVLRHGQQPLQVQFEVARDIAARIASSLPPVDDAPPTLDSEALLAFKRGQHHWQSRFTGGWQLALEQFQHAVERDPRFALAHVALASAYDFLGFYTLMRPTVAFNVARQSVERALELDDALAVAHTELALVKFGGDWDWDGSEQAFRRAIELEPGNAMAHVCYSWLLVLLGRDDAAFAEAALGHRLAPGSRFVSCGRAQTLYLARRYDEAIELCAQCLAVVPDYVFALGLRGQSYELKEMFPEAIVDLERAATITGRMPFYVGMLGHCYGAAGMVAQARELLAELDGLSKSMYVPPQCYVYLYAGLGDAFKALQYQEKAYADGASPFNYLAPSIRPLYALDPLHKHRLEQLRLIL